MTFIFLRFYFRIIFWEILYFLWERGWGMEACKILTMGRWFVKLRHGGVKDKWLVVKMKLFFFALLYLLSYEFIWFVQSLTIKQPDRRWCTFRQPMCAIKKYSKLYHVSNICIKYESSTNLVLFEIIYSCNTYPDRDFCSKSFPSFAELDINLIFAACPPRPPVRQ